jgi:hypothetical protein
LGCRWQVITAMKGSNPVCGIGFEPILIPIDEIDIKIKIKKIKRKKENRKKQTEVGETTIV